MGTVGTRSPPGFILPHPTLHNQSCQACSWFSIAALICISWIKMASLSLIMLMIASASALPFPQLTEEQFSARARSLDKPNNVLITNSYTQVRRQGRMGAEDNIKFPTLEVRNPNELSRGPVQNKLFTRGPVYKKSTADIEEKIREINRAVEAKIEEQEKKLQEEPTVEQVEEAIDTLTDLAAIEVVAEEMAEAAIMADEMAEVEKEMMVDAEEDVKEMVDLKVVDIGESLAEEIAEEIKEEIVEEMEAEELVEELVMEEMIKEAVIDEVEAAAVEENIIESEVTTVDPSEEEVDFGDITEVAV